jgi:N-acetylmuramoyl-L-alanine amidase
MLRLFLCFAVLLAHPAKIFAQNKEIILVIDPGHGGRDPGKPKGSKNTLHEKDINLKIAFKIGELIHQNLPHIKVLYTRSDDTFIPLEDRPEFANKNNAHYFISIHANSNPSPAIHGAEMHIHSHKMPVSKQLAKLIGEELKNKGKRHVRGILDAKERGRNLFVTQRTKMPSVLVEVGYLSNLKEEKYLNSEVGQHTVSESIYRAFKRFVAEKHPVENREQVYKVQIMASATKIDIDSAVFEDLDYKVEEIVNEKSKFKYKYLIGYEYDEDSAWLLAKKVAGKGYKGAFVVKAE